MLKNIIIITIRHLVRNISYTLTNIFGLAIGLATCILIFLYVQDELSYDRFFSNADNIYRMEPHWVGQGEDSHWAATPGDRLPEIVKSYPEIISSVKIHKPYQPPIFQRNEKRFQEKNVLYADSSFFEVFDYHILKGDPKTMLKGAGKIVLTKSTAHKYFGDEDPMGKFLKIDTVSFLVSGIAQDTPENSHLKFDLLVSLDHMRSLWDRVDKEGPSTFYSYVKFADKASADKVIKKYNENFYTHVGMVVAGDSTNFDPEWDGEMIFQPVTSIHLNGHAEKEISVNSDKQYVFIFSAVALFVLIIACFNYMNLATAKSTRRGREVGLRKVMGATRRNIFSQFIGESFALTIISMIIALLITEIVLPEFNQFIDKQLDLNLLSNIPLMLLIIGIVVIVGFLSGTYPSVFMAGFSPIKSIKGNSLSKGGNKSSLYLRRGLVLAQFTITIFLIIGILTVNKQLQFIQHKKLGFDKEQLVVLQMPDRAALEKMEVMKNELLQNGDIVNVAASSNIHGERIPFLTVKIPGNDNETAEQTEGEDDGTFGMRTWSVDFDFVETLGLKVADGRSFSKEYGTDEQQGFIINEAAVRQFEFENPVGQDFEFLYGMREPKRGKIIGVVEDFHYASLHHKVESLLLHIHPAYLRYMLVKIYSKDVKGTMAKIQDTWDEHIPYLPMNSFFLDTSYDNLYRKEMNTGTILGIFTIMAIIIAVLGLFGLASFVTEQRTKEIGIRRVLGASIPGIIANLSKEFIIIIAIANLLAWVPAFIFLQDWLSGFNFRTDISLWIFAISAVVSLLIAISTVGAKAWATARANPVESLRAD